MRMMTLFKVLVVLVLCVVGVGFYRGWFVLSSNGSDESNKVEVQLTVDTDKAKDDAKAIEAKGRELTGITSEETPMGSSEDDLKRNDE